MSLNVLLIGRLNIVVEDAKDQLDMPDVEFFTATELPEAKAIFRDRSIQHVFIGAGIEIEQKLEIVRAVFQDSDNTTVHLKDVASGPKGFFPFVQAFLSGVIGPRPQPVQATPHRVQNGQGSSLRQERHRSTPDGMNRGRPL
jgi:hypothetical protein